MKKILVLCFFSSIYIYGQVSSVFFGGQSNHGILFESWENESQTIGHPCHISEFTNLFDSEITCKQNVAEQTPGGSSVLVEHRNRNLYQKYWVARNSLGQWITGPQLRQAIGKIKNMEIKPNYIIWLQGERDAHIDNNLNITSIIKYKEATNYILQQLMQATGRKDCKTVISTLGRRINASTLQYLNYQLIRNAQIQLANESENVFIGSHNYDLPLLDNVHLSIKGQEEYLKRITKTIKKIDSNTTISHENFDDAINIQSVTYSHTKKVLLLKLDKTYETLGINPLVQNIFKVTKKLNNTIVNSINKVQQSEDKQYLILHLKHTFNPKKHVYLHVGYGQMRYNRLSDGKTYYIGDDIEGNIPTTISNPSAFGIFRISDNKHEKYKGNNLAPGIFKIYTD